MKYLINNAGAVTLNSKSHIEELTHNEMDKIMKLNTLAPIHLTSLLYKKKLFLDRARVSNISTLAAHKYLPSMGIYCISKAALAMATKV